MPGAMGRNESHLDLASTRDLGTARTIESSTWCTPLLSIRRPSMVLQGQDRSSSGRWDDAQSTGTLRGRATLLSLLCLA
jgi:hypothetical protein